MTAHLRAVVEKRPQPPQAHGSAFVAQHLCSPPRVGIMDADVQWRKRLVDHPLEVHFGEPREGREISEEKAQAVVVVLQIETAAKAFR